MNRTDIEKMLEKYKAPFTVDIPDVGAGEVGRAYVVDSIGHDLCHCRLDRAELICFALNFLADSFSVIREN